MDLKKFYVDPKFPGSYSGAYKFYQEVENPFNIMWECLKIFIDEYDCF